MIYIKKTSPRYTYTYGIHLPVDALNLGVATTLRASRCSKQQDIYVFLDSASLDETLIDCDRYDNY